MKFEFEKPIKSKSVVKATVHKSGRLGFSSASAELMELERNRYFKVAANAEDEEDRNIYLVLSSESDGDAFKVNKAGKYYSLRIKHILDRKKINYKEEKVIFDISENKENELIYYTLKRRKPIKSG